MNRFDDLVDTEGLGPEEEARLRHVHELLVQAGPPADLPPSLERTPQADEAEILQFPLLPRRRWAVAVLAAAALAAIAFGGGYALGHSKGRASSQAFQVSHIVAMHGANGAQGVVRVSARDSAGNWPMEMEVNGLPKQPNRNASYQLWLTRGHKPEELCGTFRVAGNPTTVRFTVPYPLNGVDGWVVTAQAPNSTAPGPVVLTT
jgi:hypothetical protein